MTTDTLTAEIKMAGDEFGIELEDGEFLAIISDATLDRDGEVIDPGAFEPLPQKITVDIDHWMSVQRTVGSGKPFYSGDRLMLRGRFASTDTAQEVRTLVTEGHIDRMSVAFRRAERRDVDGVPHIVRAELLNVAIVAIPANPSAAILAAKAGFDQGVMTVDEVRKLYDADGAAETVTLVLARPESVPAEKANEWSAAVTEFATAWKASDDEDDEISTGEAPDAAAPEKAADEAADREAATRQRRRAVDIAKARLALATPST